MIFTFLECFVEFQQYCWLEDNRCTLNIVWRKKQRSKTKQHSSNDSEIRCTLPRAINYQEPLFHEQAVSANGLSDTPSHESS